MNVWVNVTDLIRNRFFIPILPNLMYLQKCTPSTTTTRTSTSSISFQTMRITVITKRMTRGLQFENFNRNRSPGANRLYNNYLCSNSTFPKHIFNRRFRISCERFFHIFDKFEACFNYFRTRKDTTALLRFDKCQKRIGALHMIRYGMNADSVDK